MSRNSYENSIRVASEQREHSISVEPASRELSVDVRAEVGRLVSNPIHMGTTEEWNSTPSFVGKKEHIYVYTDYLTIDGENVPGIKVGDGNAYLIDAPFVMGAIYDLLIDHINDTIKHITAEERTFWNNKSSAFLDTSEAETLILSNTSYMVEGEVHNG